jgi:hypothetical protein
MVFSLAANRKHAAYRAVEHEKTRVATNSYSYKQNKHNKTKQNDVLQIASANARKLFVEQ